MKRTIRATLIFFAASAMLLAWPAAADQAESSSWDQAAVTALAQELVQAAGDIRDSVRRLPQVPAAGIRRARSQALDDLRVVQSSVRRLASQLEEGGDRLSTYPTFRRIRTLTRDIGRNLRRAAITEPTASQVAAARKVIKKLDPFYAAEAAAYWAEEEE
ncbi:MAG: hypothetical protein JRH19_23640 [Deltaproteobacteria bacterium]|nr:hypothetical protein [Deltaproteobacteria bacterium]